jgi:hypothetical protein
MASVFSKKLYFHFDGVLLEVSRLVINEIMSGRLYDVITTLRHISREFKRRLSDEIKRKQKQWGNQQICHQM